MAAHAAISPYSNYLDSRNNAHALREQDHEDYRRDYDVPEDRDKYWDQQDHWQRESPRHESVPTHHLQEHIPFSDQRLGEDSYDAPAPRFHDRDDYRRGNSEIAPVHGNRDHYRQEHDIASVARSREYYGSDPRGRLGYDCNSVLRHERLPSPDHRSDINACDGHLRARSDIHRHPSPNLIRPLHSRPARQSHNPRGNDFLAQPGNPNAMPIRKRGIETIDDVTLSIRGLPDVSPVRLPNDYPPRQEDYDCNASQGNSRSKATDERTHRHVDTVDGAHSRQTDAPAAKPLPLSDMPPNIHPSRRAIMSRELPAERVRQIANMRAPRKQLDPIAQSIDPFGKNVPSFLTEANNANAVPLGLGKKMRF